MFKFLIRIFLEGCVSFLKISHNIVSFYFESEVLLHVAHDKEGSTNQQYAVWLSKVLVLFQQEV